MRSPVRTLRSRFARTAAALVLVAGAACIDGQAVIEEQACETAPDCYQGDPCLIDRCTDGRCLADPISDDLPGGGDHDSDGRCDAGDADDDDDGLPDALDDCPLSPIEALVDYDGDGCFDGEDDDDDNDGLPDAEDACPNSVRLDGRFVSGPLNDVDGDGCADGVDNQDADGDGVPDGADLCRFDDESWVSNDETDYDRDGCRDADDDVDDDNDGMPDALDDCPMGDGSWFSTPETDYDRDGCRDSREDDDDDGDGVPDDADDCDETPVDRSDRPQERADIDGDGCDDLLEDNDDDNDGVPDADDDCPRMIEVGGESDLDGDGCVADDLDDDNDGVLDDDDDCIGPAVTNWRSYAATDHDADGCRDADEDDDDDNDGVLDGDDDCPLDGADQDTDSDGCDDRIDEDDDDDGVPDVDDACPLTLVDLLGPDYDGDGCADRDDDDDDDDGVLDEDDDCLGLPGRRARPELDRDGDGCIDGREDDDDDGDGRADEDDQCPVGELGWSSLDPDQDHDADGCRDQTEDDDDDGDGVPDDVDCADLDAARAPGLPEICDGADNDCDGDIDEGTRQVFHEDVDRDGFGDPDTRSLRCPGREGWVQDGTDCDDAAADRNPRDGCPGPLGTRDGDWEGRIAIEVRGANGVFDVCSGPIEVIVEAGVAPEVRGDFTCTFEGPLDTGAVAVGLLLQGVLAPDELGAEGRTEGAVDGVFVIIFDSPGHGLGYIGGSLPGELSERDFEAYFEIGLGGLE